MNPAAIDAGARAIVAAGRRLGARGLIAATEGNLSVRLGDRILVTPSGRRKDELTADDLLLVPAAPDAEPFDPDRPDRRPTSDLRIHRAIYAARPDVRAIAHAHLPASLALTIAGVIPDPAALPETRLLLPRLPFLRFLDPGSPELAAAIADAFSDDLEPAAPAVLLERHGAVAIGPSVGAAVDRLELVDLLCRVWRGSRLLELEARLLEFEARLEVWAPAGDRAATDGA
jgi:ribulose-5-phosphate 4-epimerase/fuculose-1-phosphate aldolase